MDTIAAFTTLLTGTLSCFRTTLLGLPRSLLGCNFLPNDFDALHKAHSITFIKESRKLVLVLYRGILFYCWLV